VVKILNLTLESGEIS